MLKCYVVEIRMQSSINASINASIKAWYAGVVLKPLELIIGVPVIATAAAGGALEHVASVSLIVMLLVSFAYVKSWPLLWRQLTSEERLLLFCFGLYFLSAILAYYNANNEYGYFKELGRYFRFFLIIPIYLLLSKLDIKLFRYLLAGAIVSGPLYLCVAYLSLAENVGANARGSYHHITFGSMAMLNAVFMMTYLVVMKMSNAMKIVFISSIACLLYASVLSQSRGAWLVLPLCLLFLLPLAVHHGKIKIRTILVSLIVIGSLLAISPVKEILISRIQTAVHEVELFQSGEQQTTSVGARLAMWDIAMSVWSRHPILGTGLGDFSLEIEASQEQGLYAGLIRHSTAHNIFFQALATTGIFGLFALCLALFIAPFRYFYKLNREKFNVASVSGIVMLIAFAGFGLTESWVTRSPPVALYLMYFIVLVSSAIKREVVSE